jgi:eukaryotic-like serine/threonine-protein kinase
MRASAWGTCPVERVGFLETGSDRNLMTGLAPRTRKEPRGTGAGSTYNPLIFVTLTAGTRLGPYEVLAPVGAGGMGEVYRARDPRLGRDVAVKVLPAAFSADPERLHRFEQEARAAAALNHPNILAVHDIGQHDSSPYIVSELLEGETLRGRLSGGALPVRKAVEHAIQIAHGLAAAHEKGITHRDLKPENVFVTSDGRVKILDFGLAKLTQAEPAVSALSALPTTPPDTVPGVVLGTIGYMAPEQVRGLAADHRSDIFAFGAILYEMLSGQRAFRGDTAADTMGAILANDPPELPTAERHIPPPLERIVDRCLEKNPTARFQSTKDLAFALEALAAHSGAAEAVSASPALGNRERLAWLVAGALLLVGALSVPFAVVHFREPVADDRAIRLVMLAPEKATVLRTPPAVSPDGRRVALIADLEGKTQIWVRPLESGTAQPLAGTDGADSPFWSPDSRFIAFFAGGQLKKIDASGGPPQTLCDAPFGGGGAWNRDGVIVFAPTASAPLHRVSSSGGASTPVTTLDTSSGEFSHRGAGFLPDGRHFLFFVRGGEKQGINVGSLDTKDRRLLVNAASAGVYASPGYVLFIKERSLMAQRLDIRSLQLWGEAFSVAEPVGFSPTTIGLGTFSVSDNGVLVYASGGGADRQLAWFDRAGKLIERIGPSMSLFDVALAPDLKRAAIQGPALPNQDILIVDLVRGVPSRLTFHSAAEDFPVWAPDGSRILFSSTRNGVPDLYQKVSSGVGNEEVLLQSSTPKNPTDWSRDGRFILYENVDAKNGADIWVLPLSGDRKPEVFSQTPFAEGMARFSPDGKWVAYVSDESTRPEVYVQSFPPSAEKWQVSTNGGSTPRWRRDGKELFYLTADSRIMSVEVKAGAAGFEVSLPKVLFEAPVDTPFGGSRYDVSPDGQRFLVNAPAENTSSASMTVVVNWQEELKRRVPSK